MGDPTSARELLNWQSSYTLKDIVVEAVNAEMKSIGGSEGHKNLKPVTF